jgi:hypothetical protein
MFLAALMTLLGGTPQVSAFTPGEQTAYEVTWLTLTAGTAQLTVGWPSEQFGHTVWPLVCVGQTTSAGAAVYRVKDRFISYWDPTAQQPVGADFFVDEATEHRRERFTYDRAGGQVLVRRQREGEGVKERQFGLPEGTMDLAATGFWLRNVPLQPGLERTVPIFTGNKVFNMLIKVEGRQQLTTQLGELDVWRLTVNGDFTGKLASKGRMTLFFTTDARQLPVRFEAELLLGTVALDITSYAPGRQESP